MEALRAINPDLICVASFPFRLQPEVRAAARLGAINAHPSLLPRHRGPDPIFWTYLDNDEETGVTIHWIDDGIDTGDMILQQRMRIPRNIPGQELYLQLSNMAGPLLLKAIDLLEVAAAPQTPQGDAEYEPSPHRREWTIDYDTMTTDRFAIS